MVPATRRKPGIPGLIMEILKWDLAEFRRHARVYWPQECKKYRLPTKGCMPEVEKWLEKSGVGIPGFIDKVKTASGDRAWALYCCAFRNWIPRDEAIELVTTAPGDRAMAIHEMAIDGWISVDAAVDMIKTAPGDRAWALYHCTLNGFISKPDGIELIRSAPGSRQRVLRRCYAIGWITKAELEEYQKEL
jgi:hypothetical protein